MPPTDCIFCRIARGEIPAMKVLDDDACLAFLDIAPLAEGHVLLIPKAHAQTLDQLSADQAAAMLRHLPALVKAVQAATGCAGVNVLQNNGKAAHQEVPHVHFHVIPRNPGDAFGFNWPAGKYPAGRAEQLVQAIQDELSR
ncbi:MAG: HIT family protein [Planctomycetota bacterium]|nr:HIT family protein [Planctomycetota bacterium]